MADDIRALEARIAELETRIRAVGIGRGFGPVANFSSGSCTNNCTAACTIGCTQGCTKGCAAQPDDLIRQPDKLAMAGVSHESLDLYQRLAGG
jgi:hypothetical protein